MGVLAKRIRVLGLAADFRVPRGWPTPTDRWIRDNVFWQPPPGWTPRQGVVPAPANWRYWLPNETWKATSARHFRPISVWLHTSEWLALAFIALATISAFLDYPLILRVSGIAIAIAAAFCLVVYLVRRDRMTRRVLEALHVVADRERRQRLTRGYQQYLRAAS